MSDPLKLYSYFRSSASYRVRIGLALKNLDYEYMPVHLVNNGGEQLKDDYLKVNPSAEVPTLVHNGKFLSQSLAILLYLDENFSGASLFPKESFEKNKIIQLCEIINSGIQPLQNLRVLKKMKQDYSWSDEQKNSWIQHWIALGFKSFENLIDKNTGEFCFGNSPTAADAFLVPQVYNAHRFELDMNPYPQIMRAYKACEKLDAFKKAHPANQPDTP